MQSIFKKALITIAFLSLTFFLLPSCMVSSPSDPGLTLDDTNPPMSEDSESQTDHESIMVEIPPFTDTISTDDYTIEKIDGTYYLSFHEGKKATESQINSCTQADITFASFQELINALKNNELTYEQKIIMQASFSQNDNGIVLCNFDQIYEPVLPDNMAYNQISWEGNDFLSFSFPGGVVHFYDRETYTAHFEKNYLNYPSGSDVVIKNSYRENYDSLPCEWTEYTQYGNTYRIGRFDITTSDGVFHVFLDYILRYTGSFNHVTASDTIPYMVTVYGELDGQYVRIVLSSPDTAPTVEWLSSFGITPYADNSDHVAS